MMNGYEIVFFIWLTLLTIGFSFVLVDMLDRTKKLKDTVINLHSYIDVSLGPQIKRIQQLVLDEITNKEDTNINKTIKSDKKDWNNIDKMIKYYEEEAKNFETLERYKIIHIETGAGRYVEECSQIAIWLKELKEARNFINIAYSMTNYMYEDIVKEQSVTANFPNCKEDSNDS